MKKFFKGIVIFICVAVAVAAFSSCDFANDGRTPAEETTQSQNAVTQADEPEAKGGFYYSQLSDVEKKAYNRIVSKIYEMPDEIYIPRLDDDQLNEVFAAVLRDNPDIFFVGRSFLRRTFGLGMLCSVDYIFTKEEYDERKAELDAVCDEVIASLSDPDDEWQTELEIHDYIVENCGYYIAENAHVYSSAYGALVNGEAACEGYSKAMQLLLDRAGIENYIICGKTTNQDGEIGPHMWNVVKINGDFYHVDCTWDDPNTGEKDKTYENHIYFNVDDETISKTHYEFPDYFECTATAENYYNKTGMAYGK